MGSNGILKDLFILFLTIITAPLWIPISLMIFAFEVTEHIIDRLRF